MTLPGREEMVFSNELYQRHAILIYESADGLAEFAKQTSPPCIGMISPMYVINAKYLRISKVRLARHRWVRILLELFDAIFVVLWML